MKADFSLNEAQKLENHSTAQLNETLKINITLVNEEIMGNWIKVFEDALNMNETNKTCNCTHNKHGQKKIKSGSILSKLFEEGTNFLNVFTNIFKFNSTSLNNDTSSTIIFKRPIIKSFTISLKGNKTGHPALNRTQFLHRQHNNETEFFMRHNKNETFIRVNETSANPHLSKLFSTIGSIVDDLFKIKLF